MAAQQSRPCWISTFPWVLASCCGAARSGPATAAGQTAVQPWPWLCQLGGLMLPPSCCAVPHAGLLKGWNLSVLVCVPLGLSRGRRDGPLCSARTPNLMMDADYGCCLLYNSTVTCFSGWTRWVPRAQRMQVAWRALRCRLCAQATVKCNPGITLLASSLLECTLMCLPHDRCCW